MYKYILLIIVLTVNILFWINTYISMKKYRKNVIKVYNHITKTDKMSKDQLLEVEKVGSRTQEKFYNLEKLTTELIQKINNEMNNNEEYQLYLLNKYNNDYQSYCNKNNENTKEL
jgi:3-hydroxyacyl-CoA dehydrogenase